MNTVIGFQRLTLILSILAIPVAGIISAHGPYGFAVGALVGFAGTWLLYFMVDYVLNVFRSS
jgi:hypothetical protein